MILAQKLCQKVMLAFKWLCRPFLAGYTVSIRSIGITERWSIVTGTGKIEVAWTFSTIFTRLAVHQILKALEEVHSDVGTFHQCAIAESKAHVELSRWTQHDDMLGDECILSNNRVVFCSSTGGKRLVWAAV